MTVGVSVFVMFLSFRGMTGCIGRAQRYGAAGAPTSGQIPRRIPSFGCPVAPSTWLNSAGKVEVAVWRHLPF
jgi:hypothetical protein